jgi:hypothetical protein
VMIGAQDAIQVIGNRAADVGLPLGHRPTLAYVPASRNPVSAGIATRRSRTSLPPWRALAAAC